MVNMSTNNGNSTPYFQRVYYVNNGHLQKGHGIGGILKGWVTRSIPIIKTKAKSLEKDLAIQGLDTVYEMTRDKLVNIKDPLEVNNFQNKSNTSKKDASQPKKAIKRKYSSKSFSRSRNIKRKRPN